MASCDLRVERDEIDQFVAELKRVAALGRGALPRHVVDKVKAIYAADFEGAVVVDFRNGELVAELAPALRTLLADLRIIV